MSFKNNTFSLHFFLYTLSLAVQLLKNLFFNNYRQFQYLSYDFAKQKVYIYFLLKTNKNKIKEYKHRNNTKTKKRKKMIFNNVGAKGLMNFFVNAKQKFKKKGEKLSENGIDVNTKTANWTLALSVSAMSQSPDNTNLSSFQLLDAGNTETKSLSRERIFHPMTAQQENQLIQNTTRLTPKQSAVSVEHVREQLAQLSIQESIASVLTDHPVVGKQENMLNGATSADVNNTCLTSSEKNNCKEPKKGKAFQCKCGNELMCCAYQEEQLKKLVQKSHLHWKTSTKFLKFKNSEELLQLRVWTLESIYEHFSRFRFESLHSLFLATDLLDRILSKALVRNFDKNIVAVALLTLAAKYHEIDGPNLIVLNFFFIASFFFKKNYLALRAVNSLPKHLRAQVFQLEAQIVTILDFQLTVPNPLSIAEILLAIFCTESGCVKNNTIFDKNGIVAIRLKLEYLLELSVIDEQMLNFECGIIAATCFYIALKTTNATSFHWKQLQSFVHYSYSDIQPCKQRFMLLLSKPSKPHAFAGGKNASAFRRSFEILNAKYNVV
ncbi:hypothetical protein RFI_06247 [Reticulomyxa filosa]|uniref:Cyclin C-terminal domain-containing protein n=1 Tax=Reticulomyxa filosa TaxID=46433 RepID=X6NYE4_RETFI|nr:hypothetical protein RFI_06247 [Reticulomyxa filosa]|eukprot:ETO30873.1 hypothetical protein RFI_06247 [Reticulomyxa filosa]